MIDDTPTVDVTFSGISVFAQETQLMIRQSDFEKARTIQDHEAEDVLTGIAEDYYLFEFSDDELFEILAKPDEWNPVDYKLSQRLLKERGHQVNDELLRSLKQDRIADLSKPDESQAGWIVFGYILLIFGGFFGFLIGWYLWTMKKTLPTGEKIYVYTKSDRKHGKRLFILGLIIFPTVMLLKILNQMNL